MVGTAVEFTMLHRQLEKINGFKIAMEACAIREDGRSHFIYVCIYIKRGGGGFILNWIKNWLN